MATIVAASPARKQYVTASHTTRIELEGVGETKEKALEQIALSLIAVVAGPHPVESAEPAWIQCEAPNDRELLRHWLEALTQEMATLGMMFGRFDVHVSRHGLQATVWGERANSDSTRQLERLRNAVFASPQLEQLETGEWRARCQLLY